MIDRFPFENLMKVSAGSRPVRSPACEELVHDEHEDQDQQQIQRKQRHGDVVGDESEDRRHDAGADVGACHLYTDDSL